MARGTTAALAVAGLALSGLFLANTTVRRMDDPTGLIDGLLFVNPAAAAASALRTDVLRLPWIYERTDAPEYRFSYPPPLGSCALFGAVGALAAALAAARMRRAYR